MTNSTIKPDLISTIQTLIADLQSKIASLEARVSTLESKRPLVIRIWFLSFEPDNIPATGKDYLFDVKLSWGYPKTDISRPHHKRVSLLSGRRIQHFSHQSTVYMKP
jgi:hypothetical protein